MTINTSICKPPHSRRLTKEERTDSHPHEWAAALIILLGISVGVVGVVWDVQSWVRMWLLCGSLFLIAKAMVLPHQDRAAFLFLWPGMDACGFGRRAKGHVPMVRRGVVNLAVGVSLIWGVAPLFDSPFAGTWVAMVGFIFAIHCGVFTLLATGWRNRGRDVMPLMDAPLLAASVTEFWGKRWNHAFHDVAMPVLFKPVARRLGVLAGTWAVFLASGLAHEWVVSYPAGAGYGGPSAYFALQAVGVSLERGCPIKSRWIWRLRALAFLLLPLPLLFHSPFVMNVCHPFFQFLNALP